MLGGTPVHAATVKIGSAIDEVRLVVAANLPTNPDGGHIDEYCADLSPRFDIKAKSVGGRYAASRGWLVTSETKLGKYDAVNIVGALDGATSGTCVHRDGNLAIFEGSRLIAIAYKRPEKNPDEAYPDSLGSAEQIDPRRIRLRWGLPAAPIADVVLSDGIYVEHTPRVDRACGGTVFVPNIFELDIRKARKKLLAYGWKPSRPSEPMNGGLDGQLRAQGVVEVEICSGTGYGFCLFNYKNRRGDSLGVRSAGDGPTVIDYQVGCRRG
jgi:hypothetical protein